MQRTYKPNGVWFRRTTQHKAKTAIEE